LSLSSATNATQAQKGVQLIPTAHTPQQVDLNQYLQSFRNLSLLTPKLQSRILLSRMVRIRLVFLAFLASATFSIAQYEYDLLTEAPNIQTAFWPALFRRACPSGYVSHLCKRTLSRIVMFVSLLTRTLQLDAVLQVILLTVGMGSQYARPRARAARLPPLLPDVQQDMLHIFVG